MSKGNLKLNLSVKNKSPISWKFNCNLLTSNALNDSGVDNN